MRPPLWSRGCMSTLPPLTRTLACTSCTTDPTPPCLPSLAQAVGSIVDLVKATGEAVKSGVSAAQTGAEYARAAYEQVRWVAHLSSCAGLLCAGVCSNACAAVHLARGMPGGL